VGEILPALLNVHSINDVRQVEIHTAEPLIHDSSPFEVEIAIAKLIKFHASDQIPAELIQIGGKTLQSKIHKIINSTWSTEELPDQWKESLIVPMLKNGNKSDCSNYRGISLLSTSYRILSNILLLRLSPYIDEIIWDHQCGF
jgi:hypothetical protein